MNTDKNLADKHLLETMLFRRSMSIPLILATGLGWYMMSNMCGTPKEWTINDIDAVVEFFKVPLLIASLIFPLGAMAIASHRSIQNVKAMRLQKAQNNFANYWLHLDRFSDALTENESNNIFLSVRKVHDVFFPKAFSEGNIDFNEAAINTYFFQFQELLTCLNTMRCEEEDCYEYIQHITKGELTDALIDGEVVAMLSGNSQYTDLLINISHLIFSIKKALTKNCAVRYTYKKNISDSLSFVFNAHYQIGLINKFSGGDIYDDPMPDYHSRLMKKNNESGYFLSDEIFDILLKTKRIQPNHIF